ncbi:Solvent efflux pump outer membrane protein SrpC [compost metagenome]
MKPTLTLLGACLLLSACGSQAPRIDSGISAPPAWRSAIATQAQQTNQTWWQHFGDPQLDALIEQAQRDSYDLAAAMARVRQARAGVTVAGGPLLPEVIGTANANREKLLRGNGYTQLDADDDNKAVDFFDASLTASYEVDFWGGKAAAYDSARESLRASEFDQATVRLTLLSAVASTYLQVLALREQGNIAELNLKNALNVLALVQTRYEAGSATALELAQQKSLVASQQRQLPLVHQQAEDALISLAVLLGQPVQNVRINDTGFERLNWPTIDAGLPSELLSRRPDIATAEAQLAAAQADVTVARAAMLPSLTLSATLGSGADQVGDVLRSPFYNLSAGLITPIFNNGRLGAQRDQASARQEELLENYRGAIINAFADVEKALNGIRGINEQRQWQEEEREQATTAFNIAQSRYDAGAEDLLTVLETQRTLYAAQDLSVQLRLARLQASVALYKAVGGGWQVSP